MSTTSASKKTHPSYCSCSPGDGRNERASHVDKQSDFRGRFNQPVTGQSTKSKREGFSGVDAIGWDGMGWDGMGLMHMGVSAQKRWDASTQAARRSGDFGSLAAVATGAKQLFRSMYVCYKLRNTLVHLRNAVRVAHKLHTHSKPKKCLERRAFRFAFEFWRATSSV